MLKLREEGWFITEEGYRKLSDDGKITDTKELVKKALDTDLKEIGNGGIPSDYYKSSKFEIPVNGIVLQIANIRNASAPKANEESKTSPRLLEITFTDGQLYCNGLEFEFLNNITIYTPPGTKILLRNSIKLLQGYLMLNTNNITVLGGQVSVLIQKWETNQAIAKYGKDIKINSGTSGGPPPWIPFGEHIQIQPNDQSFKSLNRAKEKEMTKEMSEFITNRNEAIAEALKIGIKKTFGGGNRQLIDHNVKKIMEKGYTEQQAKYTLKLTRQNLEKALGILKRQNESKINSSNSNNTNNINTYSNNNNNTNTGTNTRRGTNKNDTNDATAAKPSAPASLFDYLENKIKTSNTTTMSTPSNNGTTSTTSNILSESYHTKQSINTATTSYPTTSRSQTQEHKSSASAASTTTSSSTAYNQYTKVDQSKFQNNMSTSFANRHKHEDILSIKHFKRNTYDNNINKFDSSQMQRNKPHRLQQQSSLQTDNYYQSSAQHNQPSQYTQRRDDSSVSYRNAPHNNRTSKYNSITEIQSYQNKPGQHMNKPGGSGGGGYNTQTNIRDQTQKQPSPPLTSIRHKEYQPNMTQHQPSPHYVPQKKEDNLPSPATTSIGNDMRNSRTPNYSSDKKPYQTKPMQQQQQPQITPSLPSNDYYHQQPPPPPPSTKHQPFQYTQKTLNNKYSGNNYSVERKILNLNEPKYDSAANGSNSDNRKSGNYNNNQYSQNNKNFTSYEKQPVDLKPDNYQPIYPKPNNDRQHQSYQSNTNITQSNNPHLNQLISATSDLKISNDNTFQRSKSMSASQSTTPLSSTTSSYTPAAAQQNNKHTIPNEMLNHLPNGYIYNPNKILGFQNKEINESALNVLKAQNYNPIMTPSTVPSPVILTSQTVPSIIPVTTMQQILPAQQSHQPTQQLQQPKFSNYPPPNLRNKQQLSQTSLPQQTTPSPQPQSVLAPPLPPPQQQQQPPPHIQNPLLINPQQMNHQLYHHASQQILTQPPVILNPQFIPPANLLQSTTPLAAIPLSQHNRSQHHQPQQVHQQQPPPTQLPQPVQVYNWNWNIGDRCFAKYWEDGRYYNAEITNLTERTCVVNFMEYGNFEEVLLGDCVPVNESTISMINQYNRNLITITPPASFNKQQPSQQQPLQQRYRNEQTNMYLAPVQRNAK